MVDGKIHKVAIDKHLVIDKDGKITSADGGTNRLPKLIPDK